MTPRLHAGVLLLGLLLALAGSAAGAAASPPLPDRNPQRAPAKPLLPGEAKTIPWSSDEIAAAKAECRDALDGAAVAYEALPPLKEGLCGAPAPILVRAVGRDPEVTIEPPATMSCALAKALAAWLGDIVQPRAKSELGAPVVALRNATSYACRNRYGAERAPISEHALANALDISAFTLADGKSITVLKAWPVAVATAPAGDDAKTESGASGEAEAKTGAEASGKAGAENAAERPKLTPADRVAATKASAKNSSVAVKQEAKPKDSAKMAKDSPAKEPAAASLTSAGTEPKEPETKFVRAMHEGACKLFGTVLGPAANAAHRDHFHFDMKARRKGFCE